MEAFEKLLDHPFIKNAEDAEFAARIAARGFADEFEKLCALHGISPDMEKGAENEEAEGEDLDEEALAELAKEFMAK